MIMHGDKKRMANIIVARFGKKPESGAEKNAEAYKEMASEPEKSDMDPGLLSAAEEIHSAVKGDSAERLAEALKSFIDICYANHESEEEPEEEKPNPILG
jgi:hypothetical protein